MNHAGRRIKTDIAQVQGKGCIHALCMLGKPDAEFVRHLAYDTQIALFSALLAFAHHLQNNLVLNGMAVTG